MSLKPIIGGLVDFPSTVGGGGGGVVDGQQLFDGSHVLSGDFGARQLLDADGGVSADWSTSKILQTAPQIRFLPNALGQHVINIGAESGSPTIASAQDTIAIAPSDGLARGGNAVVIGNHVWAMGNYGLALGSGFAGGNYSSVIGGDGGATHPATRASCVGDVLTVVTDMIWSDAAAFDSHIRDGDRVIIQSISDRTLIDFRTVSSVTAATLTLSSAPANGDGQYHVFVLDAGQYGQQVYSNPPFDCGGDVQRSKWLTANVTTDATPIRLILADKDSPAGSNGQNQIRIFQGQTRFFTIKVIGLKDNITAFGGIYKGLIANASGTTALVGSVTNEEWKDAGASAWSVAITADSTDPIGELAITVTGAAASNIRWMGLVDSTEVAWFPAAV